MSPEISVIIPFYNRPERVRQAYQSVCTQDVGDIEVLLIDDGSEHEDRELQELLEHRGHHYYRIEHAGVSAARNTGLRKARGTWIALLDSDDAWLPEKLSMQLQYHREHPECLISQTEEVWYRHGKRVNKKKIHQQPLGDVFCASLERCLVSSSSTLIHRSIFDSVGDYKEELYACEDYDLWLRIAAHYEFGLVPQPLVIKYGGHKDQLSKKYPAMDRFRVYALLSLLHEERLNEEQRQAVIHEIIRKCSILKAGAEKHNEALGQIVHQIAIELSTSDSPIGLEGFMEDLLCVPL